jgi:hypothetical protein
MLIVFEGMKHDEKKMLQYTVSNPGLNHIVAEHPTTNSSLLCSFQIMFTCQLYNIILTNVMIELFALLLCILRSQVPKHGPQTDYPIRDIFILFINCSSHRT